MTLRAALSGFVVSCVLVGCGGGSSPPHPGSPEDSGSTLTDGGAPPTSDAAPSVSPNDGSPSTPDATPADPCASVSCGSHATCAGGQCTCDNGFTLEGSQCQPTPVGDPTTHTQTEVCDQYNQSATVAPHYFSVTTATCDPGTVSADGIANAVARINFHRWLVGLGPVDADASQNDLAQKCALVSAWNPAGPSAHSPSPSAQCYTQEGAQGAGSSDIAWGANTPVSTIDQWMTDWGNETTLGHRRWILNPPLDPVGFGLYEGGDAGYGGAACLTVFNQQGTGPNPDFVAYPPPGFVPMAIAQMTWSFSSTTFNFSNPTVTVTRASDGANLAVTIQPLNNPGGGNYPNATSFVPKGWTPQAGQTYHVTITGGTDSQSYDVKPVGC